MWCELEASLTRRAVCAEMSSNNFGKGKPEDYDPMFDAIIDSANMLEAYHYTQLGKPRLKPSAMLFKEDYVANLKVLAEEIKNGEYKHQGYHKFRVYEPKVRVIFAPTYRDKVVQHMVNNMLRDFYEPKFIYDSYSCIRGKGNQAAVKRIQMFQNSAYDVYDDPYHLKLDISKFFYTIDRAILKKILRKKIKGPYTLALLDQIIDSFHEPLGLPLGNLTSQLFANIYLNEIDQLIKRKYKVRYYVRYADDMFLIVENKEKAIELKNMLIKDITDILALTINPKKVNVVPAKKISGLGFNMRPGYLTLLSRNKRSMKKMIKKNEVTSLNSWYGYAHIAQTHTTIKNAINNTDILFIDNKFVASELKAS